MVLIIKVVRTAVVFKSLKKVILIGASAKVRIKHLLICNYKAAFKLSQSASFRKYHITV